MQIPFFRPQLSEAALAAVIQTLQSGWLTTGPVTRQFEQAFATYKQTPHAIGVSSCTAALHLSLVALNLPPGSEVIVPTLTYPSTATVCIHAGLKPVFADIDPHTLNIDPEDILRKLSARTRVLIPVHIAGNPCEMDKIMDIARKYNLMVIEDVAHATEAVYQDTPCGNFGTTGCFSFYATKNLTTGEGGMVTTANPDLAHTLQLLRSHGVDKETWKRREGMAYQQYDVLLPGYKANLSDILATIGLAELPRLETQWDIRKQLTETYNQAFARHDKITLLQTPPKARHACHLYILKLNTEKLSFTRDELMQQLKTAGIETSVHFHPVHLYTYYRQTFGYAPGMLPVAEQTYPRLLSLPLYPSLTPEEQTCIIQTLLSLLA